eukprot:358971-Chlamydomonas_euryale.AAC.3
MHHIASPADCEGCMACRASRPRAVQAETASARPRRPGSVVVANNLLETRARDRLLPLRARVANGRGEQTHCGSSGAFLR